MAVKDLVRRNDARNRDRQVTQPAGFDLLPQFHREIDRLFGDFFGDWNAPSIWSGMAGLEAFTPNVDIHDDGKNVKVVAELPGIDEKDLDVELNGRYLTLRGEKREEKDETEQGWHKVERHFGSFERTVQLPEGINPDEVKADYRKGVLTVTLPRKAELQNERKKIMVESDHGSEQQKKAA